MADDASEDRSSLIKPQLDGRVGDGEMLLREKIGGQKGRESGSSARLSERFVTEKAGEGAIAVIGIH